MNALCRRKAAEARNPLHKLGWNVDFLCRKVLAQTRQPCALLSEFLLIFGQGVETSFILIAVFDWAQFVTGLEPVQGAGVILATVHSSIVSHLFLNSLSARAGRVTHPWGFGSSLAPPEVFAQFHLAVGAIVFPPRESVQAAARVH